MVLHDLNQAARSGDYIIALKDGEIVKSGNCEEVMQPDILKKVFQIDAAIGRDPRTNKPMCITYNLLTGEQDNEKTINPTPHVARASDYRLQQSREQCYCR